MPGYKKLISEKNFLKVKQRARAMMRDGSDLLAIYYKERKLMFKTRSATNKNIIWTQIIEVSDATLDNVLEQKSFKDIEKLISESELKVSCNCPAFLYWGFKYIAWKKGYGLEKEYRKPRIRNPHQQGFVCKHLYLVLSLYPFWSKPLASKFKKYYQQKIESEGISAIQRPAMRKEKPLEEQIEETIEIEENS